MLPTFVRHNKRVANRSPFEPKANLQKIIKAQEAYFETYGHYLNIRATPRNEGWRYTVPWDAEDCPTDCKAENPKACREFSCLGFEAKRSVYYQYGCTATSSAGLHNFTCVAKADLDGDRNYSLFVYGTAKELDQAKYAKIPSIQAPLPAIAEGHCKKKVPAGEIYECTPNVY